MMKGWLSALVMILGGVTFLFAAAKAMSAESPLIDGEGVQIVSAQCGACHSLALVAQNRADRAGWRALIRWMQDKHGLWPLGEFEAPILDYLETHYAPAAVGRRRPLAPALMPEVTTEGKG